MCPYLHNGCSKKKAAKTFALNHRNVLLIFVDRQLGFT